MAKVSLKRYYLIMLLEVVAANLAHPVTPTMIGNLGLHSYMFGVAFASMSIMYFLFSPMWGRLSDMFGRVKILMVCCIGYALGQFLLGNITTELDMIIARMVSGFFIGGIGVCQLTYIIDVSNEKQRGRNLIIGASLQSAFGPMGFLIGGFVGTYSLSLLFGMQVFLLALSGVLFMLLLKDIKASKGGVALNAFVKQANPFRPFLEVKNFLTPLLAVFFIGVIFASFGGTAFDQSFNYYIKDIYGFIPTYNGLLKAALGIVALITNLTITIYLNKYTNIQKTIIWVFMAASILTMAVAFSKPLWLFILINLGYYAVNAIYIPMQQTLMAKKTSGSNSGQIMGFYSSLNSLGMFSGSLFAGFIYEKGANLSFIFASICFFICFIVAIIIQKNKFKGEKSYV